MDNRACRLVARFRGRPATEPIYVSPPKMIPADRLILADGVVTGSEADASVHSVCTGDAVHVSELTSSTTRDVWAEWYFDSPRAIRLRLTVHGQSFLEGDRCMHVTLHSANALVRRKRSMRTSVSQLLFQLEAAHVHLRDLAKDYAVLSSVIGPKLSFAESPVLTMRYPESFVHFSMRFYSRWFDHLPTQCVSLFGRDLNAERVFREICVLWLTEHSQAISEISSVNISIQPFPYFRLIATTPSTTTSRSPRWTNTALVSTRDSRSTLASSQSRSTVVEEFPL